MRSGVGLIGVGWLCLFFCAGDASADTIDASYFGFAADATNNYQAMRALERYANTNRNIVISFKPGTYTVQLPVSGETGYRGLQQGACMLNGATGLTIDAPESVFYCPSLNGAGQAMFRLTTCSNVNINAQFMGEHRGTNKTGVKAVHLVSSNSAIRLQLVTTRMFDGLRIGDYEDPGSGCQPLYHGNHGISVVATNVDSCYGVAAYLARDLEITCQSVGTSANAFGAHRAVYLAGCTNVLAHSACRDLNVPDGCHLITSTPGAVSPFHFGSSNVTLYATDMGTTNYVTSQSVAKLGVVNSSVSGLSIRHEGIRIHVTAPSTDSVRTNNYAVAIGAVGQGAAHIFDDVVVSGRVGRGPTNTKPSLYIEENTTGLASLDLTLHGFYDAAAPSRHSVYCSARGPSIAVSAVNSEINLVSLVLDGAKQVFTNLGWERPTPHVSLRQMRSEQ